MKLIRIVKSNKSNHVPCTEALAKFFTSKEDLQDRNERMVRERRAQQGGAGDDVGKGRGGGQAAGNGEALWKRLEKARKGKSMSVQEAWDALKELGPQKAV